MLHMLGLHAPFSHLSHFMTNSLGNYKEMHVREAILVLENNYNKFQERIQSHLSAGLQFSSTLLKDSAFISSQEALLI